MRTPLPRRRLLRRPCARLLAGVLRGGHRGEGPEECRRQSRTKGEPSCGEVDHVLKEEHNFRIHLVAAVLAVGLSVILEITKLEFIAVIIAIVLVLAAEIVNTCIEKLCDLISLEHNDQIKIIKDMAAASVLVSAIAAFIIGMVIFIPKTLF